MAPETLVFSRRNGVDLCGDLYLGSPPKPSPVVLAAPGGAWRRGHRSELASWGQYLADAGVSVFVVDYTRSETGPCFPANVEDIRNALQFLKADGGSLGLDSERMGAMGASAGAHLVSLAALTTSDIDLKSLVLAYGVYDLASHWEADRRRRESGNEDHTERMIGCGPDENEHLYAEASPISHVARNGARAKQVLLIWGEDDDIVLPIQSLTFAEALRHAGSSVQTLPVGGAGHFWFSKEPISDANGKTASIAPDVARYLRETLA